MNDVPTLQQIVGGYQRFNDWELAERRARLPRLSASESLQQFFDLCDQVRPWRPASPTEEEFLELAHSGWIALCRCSHRNG